MPTFGALEVDSVAARLPRMPDLDTEAWALPQAEILQLTWETTLATDALLPRSMHPAIPRYATVWVMRCPESPVGPFSLAQVRLMGRASAHPRGYVIGAVASTEEAAGALRARWGFPVEPGAVTLRRYHDRVVATATREGRRVLEVALVDPEAISGGDVQYIASVNLAKVPLDGVTAPRLVQVDPEFTFHKAERGRPAAVRFDGADWSAPGLDLVHPIAGSITTCDTELPRIRYVMDVEVPVYRGTRRIR
jgi:acetoacetate decarboxylase